jgi:UDP-N-acetylmuramoyl-tripeptide--D-alanyl-D-alanine ligase
MAASRLALDRGQILESTRGTLLADAPVWPVDGVVIDSRRAARGALFVALPGARTDGHEHVGDAVRRGARCLLVRRDRQALVRDRLAAAGPEAARVAVVAVEDTLAGLQGIAASHLARLAGMTRIGVTGSSGKTTTKEAIGSILAQAAPTAISEGNLNSESGLPLAVLAAGPEHRYGVFELAVDHPGEMDRLSAILDPDVAVITNIGSAHGEQLGSRDGIAAEKKKIFSRFDGRGTAFVWEGDDYREFLSRDVKGKVVTFGERSTPGYRGSVDLGLDGTAIDWEGLRVHFPLFGRHNLLNALAAISVAGELGVAPGLVRAGLERVRPLFGRSEIVRGDQTLIVDCYNSNPESLAAVLGFMSGLAWPGRRVAVLGSMLELGAASAAAHSDAGRRICESRLDRVFLFGEEMQKAQGVCLALCPERLALWTADIGRLIDAVRGELRGGDLVLIKGSRGVALERLLAPLGEPRCC